jgi:hypothetical protein
LEILISALIMGIVIASVFPTLGFLLRRVKRSSDDIQANLLLQEGMEITYAALVTDWSAFGNDSYKTSLDLTAPEPSWTILPAAEDVIEAKYHRTITVSPITRDEVSGVIGPGSVDPASRMVTTTVTWESAGVTKQIHADLIVFVPT